MRNVKLRLGVFVAPFHPLDENPTLCLERDLELAQFALRCSKVKRRNRLV